MPKSGLSRKISSWVCSTGSWARGTKALCWHLLVSREKGPGAQWWHGTEWQSLDTSRRVSEPGKWIFCEAVAGSQGGRRAAGGCVLGRTQLRFLKQLLALWIHPHWLCHLLPGWQQDFKSSWVLPILQARGGLPGQGAMSQIKTLSGLLLSPNYTACPTLVIPASWLLCHTSYQPISVWQAIQDSLKKAIMLLNKHFIFLWRHQRRSVGDDVKHLLSSVTAPAQKVLNFLWILLINWSGTVPSSETLLHISLNSTQPHFVWWVTAIDKFKGKETIKIFASESQQTFGLCCLIHSGTLCRWMKL